MKRPHPLAVLAFLASLIGAIPALGEQAPPLSAPVEVTGEILDAKIAEVEAAKNVAEDAKTKLLEFYREALSNLQEAKKNKNAAQAFRQASQTAPLQTRKLRQDLDEAGTSAPQPHLDIEPTAPLSKIEQMLQNEKADLAATSARRADIEQRLNEEKDRRPTLIQQRLSEAGKMRLCPTRPQQWPPSWTSWPTKRSRRRSWLARSRTTTTTPAKP